MSAVIPLLVGAGLNTALLATKPRAKYRVRIGLADIEDDYEPFTIPLLAYPKARITAVSPTDPQEPGTSITVTITVTNVGLVADTIWCYVDGDYSLPRKTYPIRKGGTYNFIWTDAFTMPSRDVDLTAHAGHIE